MTTWRKLLRPAYASALAVSLLGQSASAQFSNTRTTTGTAGSTAGAAGGYSTGQAGGASGSSGSMFGTGQNTNTSGLGQGGTGQTGAQGRMINQQSQLGLNQNQFLGQGNNQQNFVGRNQRNQTQNNLLNNRQQNNSRGGQNNFGQNDFNNMSGQGQQNQDQRRAIRPQYKVTFEEPQRPATEIRSTLQPRFDSLSQTPALRGVAYDLDAEGVVVLRGTVDTPSQRRLAENVVKLEPGVKKVRNELTIGDK